MDEHEISVPDLRIARRRAILIGHVRFNDDQRRVLVRSGVRHSCA